ncbi:helix-turn-helix domain-containing protein [Tropicimonas sp. TH_r6]|uniref:AraC family transcriptional regulator n=1 Tax=Tropicimonas sp. TH_r6 TaxID=3082085 RepID=UPI002953898F|nr:helix-turn-helix domain-containing protein [Tropicimonas sp. TH_r6]MDV7144319.1 helix-turn-helix domain-containing protein [Tropicimonas sp. TH_r6]
MSENAQGWDKNTPGVGDTPVRGALLLGPLAKLAEKNPAGARAVVEDTEGAVPELDDEVLISADTYLDGLSRKEFYASDPAFTARTGLNQHLTDMGLFGRAVYHSESLWDALQRVRDGLEYVQAGATVIFGMRNDRCRIEFLNPYGRGAESARDSQITMGLFFNLVRLTRGYKSAHPIIRFPRCKPEHKALFPDATRVTSATRGVVEFDAFLLQRRLEQGDASLAATFSRAMENIECAAPSTVEIVRQLQSAAIREMHRPISLDYISEILSKPSRTLQFELRRNGSSFAALRDEARHDAARKDLRAGISVEETADRLGYAQRQSFSEAFSRWEGMAPSEYASRGR